MNEENGKDEHPAIMLRWDEKTQGVEMQHKNFKSLDMILACLVLAKSRVEFDMNCARMAQLQQMQMEQQQQLAMRQQLKL